MNVFKIISSSFKSWWSNPVIILPFVFQIFISTLILGSFVFFAVYPQIGNLEQLSISGQIGDKIIEKLTSSYNYIALFVIGSVILVILSSFITAGAIGMAKEICNGRKAKFSNLAHYGKKFWLKYLLTSMLVGLIAVLMLLVLSPVFLALSLLGINEIAINILTGIFMVLFFMIFIMFLPATAIVIVNETKNIEAIKQSFKLSKENYLSLILLITIILIINTLTGYIPYIGGIITIFVVNPVQTIALVLFIISKNKKQQKKKK
ncbi:MAG: hypothetical protein V1660_03415 [archaeon]